MDQSGQYLLAVGLGGYDKALAFKKVFSSCFFVCFFFNTFKEQSLKFARICGGISPNLLPADFILFWAFLLGLPLKVLKHVY